MGQVNTWSLYWMRVFSVKIEFVFPSDPCLKDFKRPVPMASLADKVEQGKQPQSGCWLCEWRKIAKLLPEKGWLGILWHFENVSCCAFCLKGTTQKLPDDESSLCIVFIMTVIGLKNSEDPSPLCFSFPTLSSPHQPQTYLFPFTLLVKVESKVIKYMFI